MKKLIALMLFTLAFLTGFAKTIIMVPSNGSLYITDPKATWNYQPGDTLMLNQSVTQCFIDGLRGTPDSFVVVTTSDPSVTIGKGSNRNMETPNAYCVKFVNISIVGVRGTGAKMGWKMQNCSFIKMHYISIDSVGDGFSFKSDPDTTNSNTMYPKRMMFNLEIKHMSVTNTDNEAAYVGYTRCCAGGTGDPNKHPATVYGISVEDFYCDNNGWDGFQVTNSANVWLKRIVIDSAGVINYANQNTGFTVQDGTVGVIADSIVVNWSGAAAMQVLNQGMTKLSRIYLKNPTNWPHSMAIFVDDRDAWGLPFFYKKKLLINGMTLTGGTGVNSIRIQKSSIDSIMAAQGSIVNFTVSGGSWSGGKTDAVPNLYFGGTYGTAFTETSDSAVLYDNGTIDTFHVQGSVDQTVPPLAPMFMYAKSQSNGVRLKWDASLDNGGSPLLGYKVYRGVSGRGSATSLIATVSKDSLAYTDTGVTQDSPYVYVVTAYTALYESYNPGRMINEYGITYAAPGAPGLPGTVTLAGTPSNNSAVLSWSTANPNNSAITKYNIYRGASGGSRSLIASTSDGVTQSYLDNTITNGTAYDYDVRAVNGVGTASASNVITITPSASGVPSAPTSYAANPGTTGNIILTWAAPLTDGGSAITSYKVYRSPNGVNGFNLIYTSPNGSTFTRTDGGKTSGTTYFYKITATNANGEGAQTPVFSATAP